MANLSARGEWRAAWPLPFVAMFGAMGASAFAYSGGVFLQPITEEFGWSRADFSTAFMLQMMLGVLIVPVIGRLVDRVGPRRLALIGMVPAALGLAMLGLASGSVWQWWALCVFQAICTSLVIPTIWVAAVASRFQASRGLAVSIALAGLALGTAFWPVVAAFYVAKFGWAWAFTAMALTWLVPIVPLTLAFLYSARDLPNAAAPVSGPLPSVIPLLRTRRFIFLAVAGALFACMIFGLTLHLVPLLTGRGLESQAAATLAAVVGVCAMLGRVGMGQLLDRFPMRPIAVITFLLPAIAAMLLLAGDSMPWLWAAVIVLGLAQGAEIDVITVAAARQFGIRLFGSVYSVLMAIVSLGASLGPLIAGHLYDQYQSYGPYLWLILPVVAVAAVLVALIPDAPVTEPQHAASQS